MSKIRRKLLTQGDVISDNYVQDGLLLNLDGANKGTSPGNWQDLISGIIFYAGSSVIELENGFKFAKTTNSYMVTNLNLSFTNNNPSNFTIEAVFNSNMGNGLWGPIFCAGNTNITSGAGLAISIQNNTISTMFNYKLSPSYKLILPNISLQIISIQYKNKIFYRNGIKITSTSTLTQSFGHENYPSIGARYSEYYGHWNNDGHFTGDIYAIRVYNRKLSEEEILYNQSIDIKKYNII